MGILRQSAQVLLFSVLLLQSSSGLSGKQEPDSDIPRLTNPDDAQLITRDIDNFWRAYDKAGANDACGVFQNDYIDKGSIGLRDFVQLRIESACALANWGCSPPVVLRFHPSADAAGDLVYAGDSAELSKTERALSGCRFPECVFRNRANEFRRNNLLQWPAHWGRDVWPHTRFAYFGIE